MPLPRLCPAIATWPLNPRVSLPERQEMYDLSCTHGCCWWAGPGTYLSSRGYHALHPGILPYARASRKPSAWREAGSGCHHGQNRWAGCNFKPEHRDDDVRFTQPGLSETLQPSSVDLHVFDCPFDVHDLPQATPARYLAQPALPRRPRRVLSYVLRPPVGRSPAGVVLGTFTAPLAASGHAPDPETLSAPYLGRAE